jgi:tetratricopeptide (TPR) repeat protein
MSARKRKLRKAESPGPGPVRRSRLVYLAYALTVAIAVWAYAPSLHGPFLFDDSYLPFALPVAGAPLAAWLRGVRPALMLTYWINSRISGTDPFSYHLFNLALHLVNSVLILIVVRRLTRWAGVAEDKREILAWLAALVFLLHPAQTEAVAYVAGRSEVLSTLWFLAAFAVFLYRPAPAVSWGTALVVLMLFGLALLSKEQTVVLPALLLLTDFWWDRDFSPRGVRSNWRIYAPLSLGVVGAGVSFWSLIAHATSAGFALKDFTWYQYFYTQWRALFVYVATFLLPFHLTADWDFPISKTPADHGAIAGLLALVLLGAVAWKYRQRFRLAAFGFFVFLVLMAPTSSILPIQDAVAERRLYFAMPGLLLIVVDMASRLKWNRAGALVMAAALAVAAAAATHVRAGLWGNAVALWEDTARKSPDKARPHFQLASAYYEAGQCDRAVAEFERTAKLEKPEYSLLIDWALACDCINQPGPALDKLKQAAALQPTAHVYSQIARVYGERSRWAEALEALDASERIDGAYAMTFYYRAKIHLQTGQAQLALKEYQRALALEPALQQAGQEFYAAAAPASVR